MTLKVGQAHAVEHMAATQEDLEGRYAAGAWNNCDKSSMIL